MSQRSILIKATISSVLFFSLIALLYWGLGNDPRKLQSQLIDRPVPDFVITDLLNSNLEHSNKIFEGKVTLLNVWASWCTACYQEHPYWLELADKSELQLVGLNYNDRKFDALKFIQTQGNPYELTLFDHNGRLGIEFGVYGAPETFLIDPKGRVRLRHVGVLNRQIFNEVFMPLIASIKDSKSTKGL